MSVLPTDVGVELGVAAPSALAVQQYQSWIDQALYLIGKRLDMSILDTDDVDYVVLQAVVLHARHPGNEVQMSTSVDDGSVSRTFRSGAGRVTIPDDLWAILDPDLSGTSGVGSFRMHGQPDEFAPGVWAGL